ncbi:hypothetical protein [Lysobacter sp. N42]|uniref:hypothetical protein n=1 Tax=Lysobacter sp. N42 TaxID=2545719 RepID=UPI001048D277|nr:hypothetical protein [Lysobacter sp. N42]TCZ77611.1 hypothetical protein EYQ95_26020 [Lysobacter sp. N42]
MKWNALLLAPLLASCSNGEMAKSLDGSYGSLAFKGQVERRIEGVNYVYSVQRLDLTFDPQAKSNATDRIINPSLRFVAIEEKGDGTPQKTLFESEVPIRARLNSSNRAVTVENLTFVVPRHAVESADHVGLAVVGERLMWPIETDLKG